MKDVTPAKYRCGGAVPACPAFFLTDRGTYIIIGKKVNYSEVRERIGENEDAVEVPAGLLEELAK